MAGPYPLATLAPTIDANGLSRPTFADILVSLQASYTQIFGSDTSLDPSTQDGGWLSFLATMQNDTNDLIEAAYLSYSPTFAVGVGLSSLVKINGLRRQVPTYSTCLVTVVGVAGTIIPSGVIADPSGDQWALPPNTVIPVGGSIDVTATCLTPGDVTVPLHGFSIVSVQQGWQTVDNSSLATPGAPVETDAALRKRQAVSTSLPAQTPSQAITAAVANTIGVEEWAYYENDTAGSDNNGLPPHSISVVTIGGDAVEIATAIAEKKSPGTGTYGTTQEVIIDPAGVPDTINFFFATQQQIYFAVTIKALAGYLSSTGTLLIAAIAEAINALPIGQSVEISKLWGAANLSGTAALAVAGGVSQGQLDILSATYNVLSIAIGTMPAPTSHADIPIAFNFVAASSTSNGSLVVT